MPGPGIIKTASRWFSTVSPRRVALGLFLVFVGAWLAARIYPVFQGSPFSASEINRGSKAAADLDETIRFSSLVDPQKAGVNLLALRSLNQPTDALALWEEVEPLLEKRRPTPVDFQHMRKKLSQLSVLAGMFDRETEAGLFRALSEKVIHWEYNPPGD